MLHRRERKQVQDKQNSCIKNTMVKEHLQKRRQKGLLSYTTYFQFVLRVRWCRRSNQCRSSIFMICTDNSFHSAPLNCPLYALTGRLRRINNVFDVTRSYNVIKMFVTSLSGSPFFLPPKPRPPLQIRAPQRNYREWKERERGS